MAAWNVQGFTELRTLGSGAFGEVVLARHDGSGTPVAIKYLKQDLLEDAEFTEAFRSEAAILASVNDTHVVRLYEYVETPQGAAIVMELVDGVCLREILKNQGATTAEAALVILMGSLLGLAAAHRQGVVHRDYKPGNVLVNGDGDSKLTDFGIAARAGDSPIPAGTLVYAPPEQIEGSPASPAGDVYAATATFYECLVGKPPFTASTAQELMYLHLAEPVPLEPVPEPLRRLVTAGMAKDPRDRPYDASAFVAELTAVADGAYGRNWAERGRSHLAEAALLLALLWPSGAAPAVQGSTVERVELHQGARGSTASRESGQLRHVRHVRHVEHLRHLRHLRAIAAGVVVLVVAATGTALALTSAHQPGSPGHPDAALHLATVQPPPSSAASSLSPSPQQKKDKKKGGSGPSTTPVFAGPPVSVSTSASASPKPTKSAKPSPSPSPTPSPSPSPSPSASPSPSITLHPPSHPPSSSPPPGRGARG
jgi:eukaryotic-like serine/threonine-protein kinase